MLINELAQKHSATSFFNSLFLEWDEVKRESQGFRFTLSEDSSLFIPVTFFSLTGRHIYQGSFFKVSQGMKKEISFLEAAEEIIEHLAKVFNTGSNEKQTFINRVKNSLSNIELILEQRYNELAVFGKRQLSFLDAEQALYAGHTFHPTPKSRSEFSAADSLNYSPETKGSFKLEWLLIHEELYFERKSANFEDKNWLRDIFKTNENQPGYLAFPVHPWQKKILKNHPDIRMYLAEKKIIEVGSHGDIWFPTSSLRTLYNPESNYMLKFSLNVKLTNSVRNLLLNELDRGLKLHEIFVHNHPEFELIHEPVFAAIKDKAGVPIAQSLVLGRQNPFKEGEEAVLTAALTMDHVDGEEKLVHHYIRNLAVIKKITLEESCKSWFKEFLQKAIMPLINIASEEGILLGSHQQNMLLLIKDFLPVKSYFRDCNGTGFTTSGKTKFDIHEKNIIVVNEEAATYLFGYYVIINSAFNVLSSIAHSGWISETELFEEFRTLLVTLRDHGMKDPTIVNYLLSTEYLMHKGNFLCSFRNINENTEANPLSIYTRIPNPFFHKEKS